MDITKVRDRAIIHSIGGGGDIGLDSDAVSYIAAMTTAPDSAQQTAISDLFTGLKADGVYTKHDVIQLFNVHTNDDSEALIRINSPASSATLAPGSPTFTANEGFTGDETNYINLGWAPADGVNYTQNSACFWIFYRAFPFDGGRVNGSNTSGKCIISPNSSASNFAFQINSVAADTTSIAPAPGMLAAVRRDASNQISHINGTETSYSRASSTLSTSDIFVLARNTSGTPYAGNNVDTVVACGLASGLLETEIEAITTRVEAYLDALGKGVL